jgi:hypothetical protein
MDRVNNPWIKAADPLRPSEGDTLFLQKPWRLTFTASFAMPNCCRRGEI